LPDLPRRHLLEADLDAGQRLELRLERDQVLEVARRDDGDGDRLAFGLLPVDLRRAVRREVVGLRKDAAGDGAERCGGAEGCALLEGVAAPDRWRHMSVSS
jgi:hypothetical protein